MDEENVMFIHNEDFQLCYVIFRKISLTQDNYIGKVKLISEKNKCQMLQLIYGFIFYIATHSYYICIYLCGMKTEAKLSREPTETYENRGRKMTSERYRRQNA